MMRIGEFARLSRVSVKTLQYYDELGLITPARVDSFTGYRYYAHEQYGRLNRILALKDLGFSLEQIRQLLDGGLSTEQVQSMLARQAAEIRQRLVDEQGRLLRLEAWLRQLEREDLMSDYEIIVKRVPATRVASLRGSVPSPPEQQLLWEKVVMAVRDKTAISSEPCITLYHDEGPQEQDWDIEVCLPLARDTEADSGVSVRDLPAVESMASVVHNGPFMTISNAYDTLTQWIAGNGYRIAGPAREVTIHVPECHDEATRQAHPDTVVEVQFPVEKP